MDSPLNSVLRLHADSRRHFVSRSGSVVAGAALASLWPHELGAAGPRPKGVAGLPHHPPRAKRIIYLCQSGAPSQIDLFDFKPKTRRHAGQELPDSIRRGQ